MCLSSPPSVIVRRRQRLRQLRLVEAGALHPEGVAVVVEEGPQRGHLVDAQGWVGAGVARGVGHGRQPTTPDRPASPGLRVVEMRRVGREDPLVEVVDQRGLRVGVAADLAVRLVSELALEVGVQGEVAGVLGQPAGEGEVSLRLDRVRRPDVHVGVRVVVLEDAVLLELRLTDRQHQAGRLEVAQPGVLVGRVGDGQVDVDDGLGPEPAHGRRADGGDREHAVTQSVSQRRLDLLVRRRPARIGCDHLDHPRRGARETHPGDVLGAEQLKGLQSGWVVTCPPPPSWVSGWGSSAA